VNRTTLTQPIAADAASLMGHAGVDSARGREDGPAPGSVRRAADSPAGVPHSHATQRSAARAHGSNFAQLVGSHLGVAVAGLASLPVLARNLGPAAYGQFSLFMTALGVLSNLDLARPILVRELSRRATDDERGIRSTRRPGAVAAGPHFQDSTPDGRGHTDIHARALATTSATLLSVFAGAVGWILFDVAIGAALSLSIFLYCASSSAFAALSARGQVGLAGSIRNGAWAGALAITAALSFATRSPHAYIWSFVLANLATLALYERVAGAGLGSFWARPSFGALRAQQGPATDIAVFAGASAVVASADKVLLERSAPADGFGHYAAQYDLATKLNIVSTAIGAILLPAFARFHEQHGRDATAARFVRLASWIAALYFVAIGALIHFQAEVSRLVLGAAFVESFDTTVYPLLLVGVFVHLFGFLLTAYQRACGDFRTHRVTYIISAIAMLSVGSWAIPLYGIRGAVATYLTGRVAELLLITYEARRIPRAVLPPWRLAALAVMIFALASFAAAQLYRTGVQS